MTSQPLRIGVIGLGFGAAVHAPAFNQVPGCQVVAIAGRNPVKAATAAVKIPGSQPFTNWEQMLDQAQPHAITIAVPPSIQPQIVLAAAARGIAVFCEKPAASSVEAAQAMLDAVTKHNVTHAVNFLFAQVPQWQEAKAIINQMGALKSAALTWRVETYAHRHNLTDGWKRAPDQGGGALFNFVSHCAYYLPWLFGPIVKVNANLLPPGSPEDARVDAWLEFQSGLTLSLGVVLDAPFGTGHRLEVYSDNQALLLENTGSDYVSGFTLKASSRPPAPAYAVASQSVVTQSDGRTWATAQLARQFIDHLRQGASPTSNLTHALQAQRVLHALRQSSTLKQWVDVPNAS